MKIFNNEAFISAAAAKNYGTTMVRTHPKHIGQPDSPYFGSGTKMIALEQKIGAEGITRAGTFEHAMLQALDKVSGQHQFVSQLEKEAIINPDSVDAHDISIAQSLAGMSLDITRDILSRLVQGWRDLINTR
ncbi:MAG: flagellar hook-basal body complex protein FliE [Treponema sp.]|jgi:flagellar hook-basal body complex protein FliE|nr:flagellar hook-basal body complex protein FliE [Treponema sp.]